jgi:hypothetical protein
MIKLWNYLPELSLLITGWLLLDLFGSGLFRLLVRPRAKRYWNAAADGLQNQPLRPNPFPHNWLDYLAQSGPIMDEPSGRVRLRMKGVVKAREQGKWHPAECKAFFTLAPSTLVWYADITRAFLVSIKATEQFAFGRGLSSRWLLSTFPYRWKQPVLPYPIAQRNAFFGLAGAVWQPHWWHYCTMEWSGEEANADAFTCVVEQQVFFLKAKFSDTNALSELSLWNDNWQQVQAALVFNDYQSVSAQNLPLNVQVLEKNAQGQLFVRADLQVTDIVQKGGYAWW